ncbi:Pentatricopeptide repeat-containing protein [Glycine soja]|uniref:Pentatricopeptide repeat-containing protein n=1 Tax=Glycine soja TaxID=3848 RepID=A0A0B2PES5_GLYSO|nr:Pentatricopeptide repeat-containing protein [Glycine soja]
MLQNGVAVNHYTFPPLIKACIALLSSSSSNVVGRLVHGHVVDTARVLFDKTANKDVVLGTAMVEGSGKMGNVESARQVFEKMPEKRCLVECCDGSIFSALVDMYSKCGCVESALSVFESNVDKDAGTWNAMISGVVLNGDAGKSLELFHQMDASGTKPNETMFVAVLTACTHAKMVQQGLWLFEEMRGTYGVAPRMEHYACVINLLSRAGMVEEAEKFMEEKMGGLAAGDANVWGALLNACRIHKNIRVGNRQWKKLVDMGVTDCGTHVLTHNINREAGLDAEANKVRSRMKKKPGCSIIEVDNEVEEFLADDHSHSQAQEMCKMLNSILKMGTLERF